MLQSPSLAGLEETDPQCHGQLELKKQKPWLSLEEGRVGTSPGCLRGAPSPQPLFSLWLPAASSTGAVLQCAGPPCPGLLPTGARAVCAGDGVALQAAAEEPGWGQCHHTGSCCLQSLSELRVRAFGFVQQGRHRQLWCCRFGGLVPSLPNVTLAPEPVPFSVPWTTLGRARLPGVGCMAGPLEQGHCHLLIKCLFVCAGAASAWEHRTCVEASAPVLPYLQGNTPQRERHPGPCQGTPTLPLLALLCFFGRQGDKVFLFLPAASSCCSCLEASPLALKGSAAVSPEP